MPVGWCGSLFLPWPFPRRRGAAARPKGGRRAGFWLGLGLLIYFLYSRYHSVLGKELRGEIATHGVSPAGMIEDRIKGADDRPRPPDDRTQNP